MKAEDISFYACGCDFQIPIPTTYGEDFSCELAEGTYFIKNDHVVHLEVTTFGVQHWYLTAIVYLLLTNGTSTRYGYIRGKDGKPIDYPRDIKLDVVRRVSEEDINGNPDRWEGYEVGDLTNAFNSLEDIEVAIEVAKTWFPGYTFVREE